MTSSSTVLANANSEQSQQVDAKEADAFLPAEAATPIQQLLGPELVVQWSAPADAELTRWE